MSKGRPELVANAVRRAVLARKSEITTGGGKPKRISLSISVENLYGNKEKKASSRKRNKKARK
jgi:hypothetical protein